MLALVKKPHIELSIHGDHIDELLAWIKKKYEVTVLVEEEQSAAIYCHLWKTHTNLA